MRWPVAGGRVTCTVDTISTHDFHDTMSSCSQCFAIISILYLYPSLNAYQEVYIVVLADTLLQLNEDQLKIQTTF